MKPTLVLGALLGGALAACMSGAIAQISPGMNPCEFEPGPECVASSSPGVSAAQQRGTVVVPLLIISDVVGMSLRGGLPGGFASRAGLARETGLAGAVQGPRWNAWVALARSRVDFQWTPLSSAGNVDSVVLGADLRLTEKVTAGVSLAIDNTDVDTRFNNGRLSGTGFNVAPYVGWQFDPAWSLDASIGAGRANTDLRDNLAGTTGSTDATRLFGALNLNYSRWLGAWELAGKATVLHTREEKDAFTLSDGTPVAAASSRLGQFRLGGQLGYLSAGGFNPYVGVTFATDYERTAQASIAGFAPPANDRDGMVYIVGLNYFSKGAVSGGVRLQKEDRREQKLTVLLANVAIRF